ncbi:MAG: O-antigen ligase family protein [Blastocatellia bacterium]
MLTRYYPRILAAAAVMIFFTNLDVYLFNAELTKMAPLYLIAAFALAAAPLYLSKGSLLIIGQSPVARWCYGFFMITCLWFLFQPSQSEIAWQELRTRTLSLAFMLILLSVFSSSEVQIWARRAIFAMVLLGVGLNVYELFNPQTFSSVLGRSAGLYVNPNQAGVALILGMILTITLVPQRYRLLFAVIVGAGVLFTFSRSAIVGWVICVLVIIKTDQISLRRSLATGFAVAAISVIVISAQWENIQYKLADLGVLNSNVMGRLDWFNQPVASDSSALGRQEVAAIAYEKFADSPIFGEGVGASQRLLIVEGGTEISSHNQYLNLLVDHGISGIFILPFLALALLWQARGEAKQTGFAFALFILYIGFFSHNILEERFILLTFSLMAAMAFNSRLQHQPRPAQPKILFSERLNMADDRGAI